MWILLHFPFVINSSLSPKVIYNLADETPAESIVGNIAESVHFQISGTINIVLVTSKEFRYFNDFFRVTSDGNLITNKNIDRDDKNEICGPLNCCEQLVCVINASTVASYTTNKRNSSTNSNFPANTNTHHVDIELQICIHDANDNSPYFVPSTNSEYRTSATSNTFHIYIREGDVTTVQTLPLAIDLDSLPNSVTDYQLRYDGNSSSWEKKPSFNISIKKTPSQLEEFRGIRGMKHEEPIIPSLVPLRSLDYEDEGDKEIHLTVLAIDGGMPPLTGTLSVHIHVIDLNDNPPVFNHNTTELYITIPENTTMNNKPIFTLQAIDADSGENARIRYALSPLASSEISDKFSVDADTGAVRLRQALDYEIYSERQFIIPVIAFDHGSPQLTSTATLYIQVQDVNDNMPSLVVQENITIPEGVLLSKPVIKFYIKDDDEISHGKVYCSSLEKNRDHTHDQELAAGDKYLRLHRISDTVFFVFLQKAMDHDQELAAGDKYLRLHRISDTVFFVFLQKAMDYEETPRAALLIVCQDQAFTNQSIVGTTKSLVSSSIIRITAAVADSNDNPPEFQQQRYLVTIKEHAPQGTIVTTVKAFDVDDGEFGRLRYYVQSTSLDQISQPSQLAPVQNAFKIDSVTGVITVELPEMLDREQSKTIILKIGAKDGGGLFSLTEVVIDLTDINDSPPKLVGPNEFWLEENQRVDTIIGHIRFVDNDEGRNARIHLRAHPNEANKYIRVSSDPYFMYAQKNVQPRSELSTHVSNDVTFVGDGEIRAMLVSQMPVDRESYATLFYEIIAYDDGDPRQSVTSTIVIQIVDQNDNAPFVIFPSDGMILSQNPSIHVNSPLDTLVTKIRATDVDQGENGTIWFNLREGTNGSRYFTVNRNTGDVKTAWEFENPKLHTRFNENANKPPPIPGLYLIKLELSDNGLVPNTREHQFYIEIFPERLETQSEVLLGFDSENEWKRSLILSIVLLLCLVGLLSLTTALIICKIRRNREVLDKKPVDFCQYYSSLPSEVYTPFAPSNTDTDERIKHLTPFNFALNTGPGFNDHVDDYIYTRQNQNVSAVSDIKFQTIPSPLLVSQIDDIDFSRYHNTYKTTNGFLNPSTCGIDIYSQQTVHPPINEYYRYRESEFDTTANIPGVNYRNMTCDSFRSYKNHHPSVTPDSTGACGNDVCNIIRHGY